MACGELTGVVGRVGEVRMQNQCNPVAHSTTNLLNLHISPCVVLLIIDTPSTPHAGCTWTRPGRARLPSCRPSGRHTFEGWRAPTRTMSTRTRPCSVAGSGEAGAGSGWLGVLRHGLGAPNVVLLSFACLRVSTCVLLQHSTPCCPPPLHTCSSAAYFRDIQWVRRALTVPAADSPYLQNDRCGSGRFSLRLFEGPLGQAGDEADAGMPTAAGMGTTAALPSRSGLTSTSSTAETKAAIATISGCGSSGGSGGGEPAGRQAPGSLEPPLERSDLDIVFGHGGFRGLRLWMVLRMVRGCMGEHAGGRGCSE